jgi:hypothetical protein
LLYIALNKFKIDFIESNKQEFLFHSIAGFKG